MSSLHADFAPGRLWSLWDIMQTFDGGRLLACLHGLSDMTRGLSQANVGLAIPLENYRDVVRNIEFVCAELEKLELDTSLASARELKDILLKEAIQRKASQLPASTVGRDFCQDWMLFDPLPLGRYQRCSSALLNRFKDEVSARVCVTLSRGSGKFLNATEPLFGDGVFNAFPSANDDIAEAGACLAFERGTACVMHLMRAAEVGLAALAKAVGVGKQNDWGSYLREIEKELVKRAKASGARTPDEQFYSESATSFDHLKRAWRNPTMHVDRSYPPDRALEIFDAVKSFMRHLATKISE